MIRLREGKPRIRLDTSAPKAFFDLKVGDVWTCDVPRCYTYARGYGSTPAIAYYDYMRKLIRA